MRKKKSFYNIFSSLSSYFISIIFTFITQTMIVKILGIEYSGVNGLFANILTMLSVAELGIGTAIIYKLYEPLSKNNKEEIKSWMNFYRMCYRYVALSVFIIGLVIIPFIPSIVGNTNIKENLYSLYFISLLDVVFSYIMTYKRSLLYADQKNYIINIVHIGYVIFMNICQVLIIWITKNYLYFLLIRLLYRLLENVIINTYVNRNYSYVNEKSLPINREEKNDIVERIKAIFIQKVAFVVNKGIDSIIISMILGVATVGYYTNYNLIATTLSGAIYQIISGFIASVGNLLTERNNEKNYTIYKIITFMNSTLTAISISAFLCCVDPFVKIWLGEDYILSFLIVISFSIYIYSDSIRRSITIYKEAAGICKEDKYVYIVMAIINLLFSIVLCSFIGTAGVVLGTAISYMFLIIYSYPKYIFKKVFNRSMSEYYIEKVKFVIIMILSVFVSYYTCSLINLSGIIKFIINGAVASIETGIIILIVYKNTLELDYLKKMIYKVITHIKIS